MEGQGPRRGELHRHGRVDRRRRGIVLDGRLLDGNAGNAGHIGHVVVEPEGTDLDTHVQGVLEAEVSGTGIAARTGRPAEAADEAERIRAGRLVGRAVGSIANLLDLQLAVVAGSVALGFGDTFFALPKSRSTGWPICNTRRARSSHRPNSAPTVR